MERDPSRIHPLLDAVRKTWCEFPDQRLGQLLVNAVRPEQPCPDLYNIEDTVLVRKLDNLAKRLRTSPPEPAPTSVQTFVTEDEYGLGQHGVQWQLNDLTISCIATDLSFARRLAKFVKETRANPDYRDRSLGNGVFKTMPEASIDLSSCFRDIAIHIEKLGEYDHGYVLRISAGLFSMSMELHNILLDDFINGLLQINKS
jgi:hypothetical protein